MRSSAGPTTAPHGHATQGSTPGAPPRPFAPKAAPAQNPASNEAPPNDAPWQAPGPVEPPAAIPAEPPAAGGRRTPRMLAALVEQDQVSLWPVVPGVEQPGESAAPPNEISFLRGSEPDTGGPQAGWGIEPPAQSVPDAAQADSSRVDDLFDRLLDSLPEAPPHDGSPLPELELPPVTPADDVVDRRPVPELSARDEPVARPEGGDVRVEPLQPAQSLPMPAAAPASGSPTDPRLRAVEALEAMARRVRNGEIVLPEGPSLGNDAAVLAAVLTALLEGRD